MPVEQNTGGDLFSNAIHFLSRNWGSRGMAFRLFFKIDGVRVENDGKGQSQDGCLA